MIVTLIRHGQIPANIDRRYVGRTDESLTETGRAQAAAFEAPEVDKVFVSPYSRCIQTAEIIFPRIEKVVVEDLREMDFGIFEYRTAEEMADFEPYRKWVDSMCEDPIPEGESMAEFDDRCCAAFEQIALSCSNSDRIALVVHGGTIMSIMGRFGDEGIPYFSYHLNNCEHYVCECQVADDGTIVLRRIGGKQPEGTLPPSEEERGDV